MSLFDDAKNNPILVICSGAVSIAAAATLSGFLLSATGRELITSGTFMLTKDLPTLYVSKDEHKKVSDDLSISQRENASLRKKIDQYEIKFGKLEEKAEVQMSVQQLRDLIRQSLTVQTDQQSDAVKTHANKPEPPASSTSKPNDGKSQALVFNPPTIIREKPNGKILCWVETPRMIGVFGPAESPHQSWLRTDACPGADGFVHMSQLRTQP